MLAPGPDPVTYRLFNKKMDPVETYVDSIHQYIVVNGVEIEMVVSGSEM